MKKTHRLTVIVALAVLAAAWGPLCGNAAADDLKTVTVPVRITQAEGKEGGARLMQLLYASETFFGRELRVEVTPNLQDVSGTTLLGFLQMRIPPGMTEKAAFENLKAGLKRLGTLLRIEQEKDRRKLLDMLQVFEANIEENRTRLRALQHDMPPNPSANLSEISKAVEGLRGQVRELQIQNVAKKARLEATEVELAKLAAASSEKNDPLATELAKVVELCEKQLQRVKALVSRNAASQEELEKAALKLAEAKVELARVMAGAAAGKHSPELVARLRGEATTLVIDLKELEARQDAAQRQLAEAEQQQRELLKARKEFQAWQLGSEYETSLVKRELERAQTRRAEILEQIRALEFAQPTVTIVDPAELDGAKGDKTQPAPKSQ
jgi:chromosome segregation ATPase